MSKELRAIFDAIDHLPVGDSATLATLVSVQGSSYRRPGARMLILSGGRRIGAISGGCLEADLAERAAKLPANAGPTVVTYNTGDANDAIFGVGMGCKGVIKVMLEGVERGHEPRYLQFLRGSVNADSIRALATVFGCEGRTDLRIGDRLMLAGTDLSTQGDWSEEPIARVADACRAAMANGRPGSLAFDLPSGRVEICIEPIRPCTRLIIFGANISARPVAALARQLGWYVTVCDRRPAYVEDFPDADERLVATASEANEELKLDRRTAAVIMTHNYADDMALLTMLLPTEVAYVGLLGARSRTGQLIAELRRDRGISEAQLQRLYSPVGLDIGADTPDEIALSILSEVQAVMAGRAGSPLRDRPRAIHEEAGR